MEVGFPETEALPALGLAQTCWRKISAALDAVRILTVARQRLGQHFLTDTGWRARIIAAIGARAGDVWLEIGAGHGEMTRELARRAARVLAVELDAKLVERLRSLARELPNVEIASADVLELDFSAAMQPHLAQSSHAGRFKVYGNLPYYITSPILHRLFENADGIEAIHIVVQWEVAARLVARPGRREYAYLSALAQYYARPEIRLRIPPGAFRPRPKVASALVSMLLPGARPRLDIRDEGRFLDFVQSCFAQKRKTLLNNLRAFTANEQAAGAIHAAGLRADARAEQLHLEQFAELYRVLKSPA